MKQLLVFWFMLSAVGCVSGSKEDISAQGQRTPAQSNSSEQCEPTIARARFPSSLGSRHPTGIITRDCRFSVPMIRGFSGENATLELHSVDVSRFRDRIRTARVGSPSGRYPRGVLGFHTIDANMTIRDPRIQDLSTLSFQMGTRFASRRPALNQPPFDYFYDNSGAIAPCDLMMNDSEFTLLCAAASSNAGNRIEFIVARLDSATGALKQDGILHTTVMISNLSPLFNFRFNSESGSYCLGRAAAGSIHQWVYLVFDGPSVYADPHFATDYGETVGFAAHEREQTSPPDNYFVGLVLVDETCRGVERSVRSRRLLFRGLISKSKQ